MWPFKRKCSVGRQENGRIEENHEKLSIYIRNREKWRIKIDNVLDVHGRSVNFLYDNKSDLPINELFRATHQNNLSSYPNVLHGALYGIFSISSHLRIYKETLNKGKMYG